jgi:carbamoyl-phosphate synthase large subunit
VLVFPGGTEIGLEIWKSLRWHRDIDLFSAGAPVSSHASYVFARHFDLPMVTDSGWLAALQALLVREKIEYVFPGHDDATVALVRHRGELPAIVVTSPSETCEVCRSKSRTYESMASVVPVPNTYNDPHEIREYPVFVKPDRGQGSKDTHLVRSSGELASLVAGRPDHYIVTEYLPGDEFTVDCLTDYQGNLLYAAGRRRIRVRDGISVDTVPVEDPVFQQYAKAINRRLRFEGGWFFQLKRSTTDVLKLLEVAPRIAGAMALDRVQGVNIPLLSLYICQKIPVEVLRTPGAIELDRALVNRYRHHLSYSRAYVDLDDSVLIKGRVNTELIALLYQCVNQGVRLILVTRHAGDLAKSLRDHHLEGLFDDVRPVPKGLPKSSVIDARSDAIFVDDSFAERKEVATNTGLPTFDSSMIELLLDERR